MRRVVVTKHHACVSGLFLFIFTPYKNNLPSYCYRLSHPSPRCLRALCMLPSLTRDFFSCFLPPFANNTHALVCWFDSNSSACARISICPGGLWTYLYPPGIPNFSLHLLSAAWRSHARAWCNPISIVPASINQLKTLPELISAFASCSCLLSSLYYTMDRQPPAAGRNISYIYHFVPAHYSFTHLRHLAKQQQNRFSTYGGGAGAEGRQLYREQRWRTYKVTQTFGIAGT